MHALARTKMKGLFLYLVQPSAHTDCCSPEVAASTLCFCLAGE